MLLIRGSAGLAGAVGNAAWAWLVFSVLTRPFEPEPGSEPHGFFSEFIVPAAGHLMLFGVMAALLLAWGLGAGLFRHAPIFTLGTAFVVTTAYGAAMELAQRGVPGRFASIEDVILDAIGAIITLAVARACYMRLKA